MSAEQTSEIETLRQALATQSRQQEELRQVIESISRELELGSLLTHIVERACELLGADRGTIGLVDAERKVVRTEAAYHMPPGELGAEMPPGVGLAGHVLLTQQPIVLYHYGEISRPTQPDLVKDAVVGVPILWHENMIGFFGIGAASPRQFTEHDVETLMLFARHAAVAIENAKKFAAEQRRTARNATINRIGQLVTSSLSIDQILQTAIDAIYNHLHFSHIALLLADPIDPETLVLRARSGVYATNAIGEYRQSIQTGIIGAAARSHRRVLIPDVRKDPRYIPIPGAEELCSELAVPIVVGERLLGIINVESEKTIVEEDADDFQIIADQLGGAIENARLFDKTQRALDEMRLLYETSQRISTAMDANQVVAAYLDQVAARGQYTCNIVLYEFNDAGERTAVIVYGRWSPEDGRTLLHERLPYSRDVLDPPLDAGQTIAISDVHTDPRVSPELREIQTRDERPALVLIPLIARRQRIGLVVLSYPLVHEWNETDLRLYKVTAAQLGTAIDSRLQQSLLYERGQQLAILEERQRLARELHDSVTQMIFSMTLIAQSLTTAWQRDPSEGERRVHRMQELSERALVEMRALLTELHPPQVAETPAVLPGIMRVRRDGLIAALHQHVSEIEHDGLVIELDTHEYTEDSPPREEALFRIAQEALNNGVKHSRAQHVCITLRADDLASHLKIHDDGIGFAPDASMSASRERIGLGLGTMRERAEMLGGICRVMSAPSEGTTVQVMLPRKERQ